MITIEVVARNDAESPRALMPGVPVIHTQLFDIYQVQLADLDSVRKFIALLYPWQRRGSVLAYRLERGNEHT